MVMSVELDVQKFGFGFGSVSVKSLKHPPLMGPRPEVPLARVEGLKIEMD